MRDSIKGRPVEILLVDDSEGDVRLTREALREGRISNNLENVSDGVEAMQYLRQQGPYANAVRPDLILLDLNMSRKDGREVLAEIKADPVLKHIPVVVLTTSNAEKDVLTSYGLHASCYITKPVDFAQFMTVVHQVGSFWFSVVRLPADIKSLAA
jgi:CheY-like chemotaxis protein